nr:hypothetical protein [uncultured Ottowia sp.]
MAGEQALRLARLEMGFHSYGPDDARREKKGKIRRGEFKLALSFCSFFDSFQRRKVARQGCLWNGRSSLLFDALRLAEWRAVWRLSAI